AATLQSLGFAVSGALLMQLLPGLVMQSQVTGAAWGWSRGPECKPAAGSNWAFSSTPHCGNDGYIVCNDASASLPASFSAVFCPSSNNGKSSPDNGWWSKCGPGRGLCAQQMEIGSGLSCTDATPTATPAAAPAAGAAKVAATTTAASTGSTKAAAVAAGTAYGSPAPTTASFGSAAAAPGLLFVVAALAHLA
ncbi:unnamed protein product, partial [Polarella glacialis]